MVTLAVDTSTSATSVAIVDAGVVLGYAEHVDARRHAELLAPMIAEVRGACGNPVIDLVACGIGPGAYTGLRVGISTVQALALAWRAQVVGLCSLDVLAVQAAAEGIGAEFAVASDARRREVYWARYDASGRRLDGPHVHAPALIDAAARALPWIGEGARLHPEALVAQPLPELRFPRADVLALEVDRLVGLGELPASPDLGLSVHGGDDGATARSVAGSRLLAPMPLYVRRPDAAAPAGAS